MAAPIYRGGAPFIGPGFRGKRRLAASASATVTLAPSQSNGSFLFDRVGGGSFTLPAPTIGLTYDFYVTVLQTGGANVIVTNAASVFLLGAVAAFSGEHVTPSSTLGPYMFAADGSTIIKITTNGTTTGGGIGSWFRVHAISLTQWFVCGVMKSPSGSIATPFST